ncbi:jg9208 [Pararge aegeria aegeria]|uniref:Jg9208 protein n=1 Tax=Pararge aegeria aegeria TaxID=348720 RepID=A0A8S4SAK7_9NEOP|nr:jg9208 [Pararge aegeria aegeria]
MKIRSFHSVIVAVFAIGSVVSQNAEELPIHVETDNQFPPEYSELDGRTEGSESTAADNTQQTSGSAIPEISASTSANAETVFDEGNESTVGEPTEPTPTSSVTDGAEISSVINDENINNDEDTETTAAETTQATLESTKLDIHASSLTADNEQDSIQGSETRTSELSEAILGSTIADTVASTLRTKDEQETNSEIIEKTAAQIMSDIAATTLLTKDAQDTTNEGSETTAAESTERTSGLTTEDLSITNDNEQVTNNEGGFSTTAETTQTTSGFTTVDVAVPIMETRNGQDTTNKGSETTAAELTELTTGTTVTDVAESTMTKDEQKTTNGGTESTPAEPTESPSGSTISEVLLISPTLTTEADVTNKDVSETRVVEPMPTDESSCPKPCVCITEGDSSNFIVDCSNKDLTELPTPLDLKTTTLKIHNNKLSVIPKAISGLKNLKVLDASDNLITELESGSVSELPELLSLKLANNRLLEYPKDLENTLFSNKIEELDLAGNDIKVTPETFLNYKALRTVNLPEVTPDLLSELCTTLKETLVTVCTQSCNENSFKCADAPFHMNDNSLDATLPGMIPFIPEIVKDTTVQSEEYSGNSGVQNITDTTKTSSNLESRVTSGTLPNLDALLNSGIEKIVITSPVSEAPETSPNPALKKTSDNMPVPDISSTSRRKEFSEMTPEEPQFPETLSGAKENLPVSDFSLRTAVNNAPQEKVALQNIIIDTSKEPTYNETVVTVGAKTTDIKGGGGVDKSVIAVIVAGMVIIIAVITVKKNWSSIRKRFSSDPRPNDRSGRNENGTTAEEVPLQDKSPV